SSLVILILMVVESIIAGYVSVNNHAARILIAICAIPIYPYLLGSTFIIAEQMWVFWGVYQIFGVEGRPVRRLVGEKLLR
ncbi:MULTISPECIES: hypothetical protein, partial [unclassified Phaeobacter]|uniref:hypothetical protein n=1 Tax=unclassified Phaeobacter TaxID=2621772 RepID=UPI003A85EEB9